MRRDGLLINICIALKMKQILITLLITICTLSGFSQKSNCGCDKKKINPENQYRCDTTFCSNGAKMYWQWNCDSAWFVFENKEKIILQSCRETDVYECQRTGLDFLKEYPNYLLFQHKWISGCCTPPDIVFVNKENGRELKRITNNLFVWGDIDENYVLYFSDTIYTDLIYLDHNTEKEYSLRFDKAEIEKSVAKNQVLQLTDLFKNFKKDENDFTFDFKTSEGVIKEMNIELK